MQARGSLDCCDCGRFFLVLIADCTAGCRAPTSGATGASAHTAAQLPAQLPVHEAAGRIAPAVEAVGTFASRWPVLRPGQLHAWLRRSPREKKSTRAVTDAQEHPSVSCSPVSGTTDLCIHTETTMRKMKMRCHYSAARKRNVKRMKMKSSENVRKRKR